MDAQSKFIGSGIIFPIEVNAQGRVDIVNDMRLIRASILDIINWPTRIRFFNEQYGCRIEECLEEPDDTISRTLAKHFMVDAISKWEKRVDIDSSGIIILESSQTVINMQLTYRLRNTKIEETYIFPFYKEINY